MKKIYVFFIAAVLSTAFFAANLLPAMAYAATECGEGYCAEQCAQAGRGQPKDKKGEKTEDGKKPKDGKRSKDGKKSEDGKNRRDDKRKRPHIEIPDAISRTFARLEKGKPPYLVAVTGTKQKDSPYYKNIIVKIYDLKTQKPVYEIVPGTDSGYEPSVFAGDFDGSGTQQIALSIQSGGSGAFGYYYIYKYAEQKAQTLFDYQQFSKENTYSAQYLDNYRVQVTCQTNTCKGNTFMIDISKRPSGYLEQLYNSDGTLIAPKTAYVSDLNSMMPMYNAQTGRYDMLILQRVTGLYNADLLGYVNTVQSFEGSDFKTVYTTLGVLPV